MKKFFFYFLGALSVLGVFFVGALFVPAVQKAAVLSFLRADYGEATVDAVSAGFERSFLAGFDCGEQ